MPIWSTCQSASPVTWTQPGVTCAPQLQNGPDQIGLKASLCDISVIADDVGGSRPLWAVLSPRQAVLGCVRRVAGGQAALAHAFNPRTQEAEAG